MGGAAATVPFGGDQDAAECGLKAVALNEIFGAVGRHRQILADDRAAGPQNMVAQPSGSLGIVLEHAGAEYRNGWDAGAKRDRKSGASGPSVSVREGIGGRHILKKKT